MKRPSVTEGIVVGAALSIAYVAFTMIGAISLGMLRGGFGALLLVCGSYLLYLMYKRERKLGAVVVSFGAFLWLTMLWTISSSILTFVVGIVILIWLVRSTLNYKSVLCAIGDGFLCVLSCGLAMWAYQLTRSLPVTVWCFFLMQALWVFIPQRVGVEAGGNNRTDGASFDKAYAAAEVAVRRLAN